MKTFLRFRLYVPFVALVALLAVSCTQDPPTPEKELLTIDIANVTDISYDYTVTPKDNSVRFMFAFSPADFYEEMGGDAGVADAYLENLSLMAQAAQKPVEQVFAEFTYQEEFKGSVEDADPETDYVFFAFAVDEAYQQCSKLFKKTFTTQPLKHQDVKFTVEVGEVTESTATITITPDKPDALYFHSFISDAQLNELFPGPNGYADATANLRDYYIKQGYYPDEIVQGLAVSGTQTFKLEKLTPGIKYHVFAIGVNAAFLPNSDAVGAQFNTVAVPRSDIQFAIDTIAVTVSTAKGVISPTNKDNYIWGVFETAIFESFKTDDEFMTAYAQFLDEQGMLESSICSGDTVFDLSGLRPGANYTIAAFAYNHIPVSDLKRFDFKTKQIEGDPCEMTFKFEFSNGAEGPKVDVIPSMGHYYWYDVMAKADYDAMAAAGNVANQLGDALYEQLAQLSQMLGGTPQSLLEQGALVGVDSGDLSSVTPGVELVVYAFAVDLKTAKNACDKAYVSDVYVAPASGVAPMSFGVPSINKFDVSKANKISISHQFAKFIESEVDYPCLEVRELTK